MTMILSHSPLLRLSADRRKNPSIGQSFRPISPNKYGATAPTSTNTASAFATSSLVRKIALFGALLSILHLPFAEGIGLNQAVLSKYKPIAIDDSFKIVRVNGSSISNGEIASKHQSVQQFETGHSLPSHQQQTITTTTTQYGPSSPHRGLALDSDLKLGSFEDDIRDVLKEDELDRIANLYSIQSTQTVNEICSPGSCRESAFYSHDHTCEIGHSLVCRDPSNKAKCQCEPLSLVSNTFEDESMLSPIDDTTVFGPKKYQRLYKAPEPGKETAALAKLIDASNQTGDKNKVPTIVAKPIEQVKIDIPPDLKTSDGKKVLARYRLVVPIYIPKTKKVGQMTTNAPIVYQRETTIRYVQMKQAPMQKIVYKAEPVPQEVATEIIRGTPPPKGSTLMGSSNNKQVIERFTQTFV